MVKKYVLISKMQIVDAALVKMAFNTSANFSCDGADQVSSSLAVGIAVVHILLVVVPSLPLGVTVLLVLKAVERDQVTTLFACTTVVCMVGPWTHGLLMDISLITDKPVIGQCGTLSSELFFVFYAGIHLCLLMCATLISVTQFISVRFRNRRANKWSLSAFFISVVIATLLSLPNIAVAIPGSCKIRGSVCMQTNPGVSVNLILIPIYSASFLVFITLVLTIIVTSVLTYKVVRREVIEESGVRKSVLAAVALMTVASVLFRAIPILNFVFYSSSGNRTAKRELYDRTVDISADLSYPLYLCLMLFVHKKLRNKLKEKAAHIWYTYIKRETRVVSIHITQED